jgi:hypothetical protein
MSLLHTLNLKEEIEIKPKRTPKPRAEEEAFVSDRDFKDFSGDEAVDKVDALSSTSLNSIRKQTSIRKNDHLIIT